MQKSEPCLWYLIKLSDGFAIQYTGPNPDQNFKPGLHGACCPLVVQLIHWNRLRDAKDCGTSGEGLRCLRRLKMAIA